MVEHKKLIGVILLLIGGVCFSEIEKVDPAEFSSMQAYSAFRVSSYEEVTSLIYGYQMEYLAAYGTDSDISEYGYAVIFVEPAQLNGVKYYGFVISKEAGKPYVRFYGLRK